MPFLLHIQQCQGTELGTLENLELKQILVLILGHIRSTANRIGATLSLWIGNGPTLPVISVSGMSPSILAHRYQLRWLLCMLNLINT